MYISYLNKHLAKNETFLGCFVGFICYLIFCFRFDNLGWVHIFGFFLAVGVIKSILDETRIYRKQEKVDI